MIIKTLQIVKSSVCQQKKLLNQATPHGEHKSLLQPMRTVKRDQVLIIHKASIISLTQIVTKNRRSVDEIVNFKIFGTLDLKSAYHQIPLLNRDKIYNTFEANGKLYQFTRISFSLTNAVAELQQEMDNFIAENDLKNTQTYLDNLGTAGNTQKEHNENL